MNRFKPVKVVVADASFVSRRGLRSALLENEKFDWLAESTDYENLEELLKVQLPDVLIMGHAMEDCFSVEEIGKIKNKYTSLNILVISDAVPVENIKKIINLGIKNYVLKDCSEKEITDAIVACHKGQKYFCNKIRDSLLEWELSLLNIHASTSISEREMEVINLLVSGKRPKEIAEIMKLSYHTIVTHKRNIFSKLEISNSIELAQYVIKTGLKK